MNDKQKPDKKRIERLAKLYTTITLGKTDDLKTITQSEVCEFRFTNYNWSMLHLAVWYNQKEVAEFLLLQPYSEKIINEKDSNGETPLHLAIFKKSTDLIVLLINKGASLDLNNTANERPMEIIKETKTYLELFDQIRKQGVDVIKHEIRLKKFEISDKMSLEIPNMTEKKNNDHISKSSREQTTREEISAALPIHTKTSETTKGIDYDRGKILESENFLFDTLSTARRLPPIWQNWELMDDNVMNVDEINCGTQEIGVQSVSGGWKPTHRKKR